MKVCVVRTLIAAGILSCISVSLFLPAEARKIRTKNSIPKSTAKPEGEAGHDRPSVISLESDSVDFSCRIVPAIRFYGFDKTVTSGVESFFISNGLDKAIRGMEIEIIYYDMKGRQLHRRTVSIDCDIPPGETMRTDIKSWDTQKSFYFHQSVKPRRQATPFDVRIDLRSVSF